MNDDIIVWLLIIFFFLALSLYLFWRYRNKKTALSIAVLCLLFPTAFVMKDCAISSHSEACVWGQSFMPLYWGLALFAALPFFYSLVTGLQIFFRNIKKKPKSYH